MGLSTLCRLMGPCSGTRLPPHPICRASISPARCRKFNSIWFLFILFRVLSIFIIVSTSVHSNDYGNRWATISPNILIFRASLANVAAKISTLCTSRRILRQLWHPQYARPSSTVAKSVQPARACMCPSPYGRRWAYHISSPIAGYHILFSIF